VKNVSAQVARPTRPDLETQSGETAGEISWLASLDALIAEIEAAPVGSAALDARLHYGIRVSSRQSADIAAVMVEQGISWPTVEQVLEDQIPPFTTSLDAALEGENISFVIRSAKRGQWGAMQKAATGEEVLVWAATEPLARRLAAIRAWRTDLEKAAERAQKASVPAASGGEPAGAHGSGDWEVLF